MKKVFIIISIILFILVGSLGVFVQSDRFSDILQPYVVGPAAAYLGPEVKIGRVKANLIPPYLEGRDISVSDSHAREPVGIHKVRVYINPLPLLVKKISLPLIVIIDPHIAAERSTTGEISLSPIIDKIGQNILKSSGKGRSRYRVSLRTVTIKDGAVTFFDKPAASRFSLSDFTVNAKVNLPAESVKLSVKTADVQISAASYPRIDCKLKAAVEYRRGKLQIDSFELSSAGARLSAVGMVGILPAANLDLRLRCSLGPEGLGKFMKILQPLKKQQGPFLEGDIIIKGGLREPEIRGSMKVVGVSFSDMLLSDAALTLAYKNKNLEADGANWRLSKGKDQIIISSVKASLSYREGGVDIQSLNILAEDMEMSLKGRADPSKGFESTLSMESSGTGKALSLLTSLPLYGTVGIKGDLRGALTSPVFDGALYAGPVTVKGTAFHDVKGGLLYNDKKFIFSEIEIYQGVSRYMFDGTVDVSGKDTVYDAKLRAIQSDIAPIVAMFYREIPIKVTAAGELFFSGTSRDFSGGASLTLNSGAAYGESFERGSISVSLSRDKVSFPQIVLYKGSGAVKAYGWIGFDGSYSAYLESKSVELSELTRLAGLPVAGMFKLDIKSSGSFSSPSVKASLNVPDLSFRQTSLGTLSAEAEINNRQLAFNAELTDGRAYITGAVSLKTPYAWSADMTVNSETIDPFLAFGSKELVSRASLAADGSIRLRGEGMHVPKLFGSASFSRLSLSMGDYSIENESDASLEIAAGRITVKSLRFTGPGTRIAVSGGARLMKDIALAFTGSANLSLLRLPYKEVEYGEGEAVVALTVKEDWNNPVVSGELNVKKGELKIKDIPQKFTALNGKIGFDNERIIADSLTGEIGGGNFTLSGKAQLTGLKLEDFSFKTLVENVTVRYPAGLVSTLDGELYYDGNASEQTLSGDVTIKRGKYDKRVDWKSMLADVTRGFYQKRKTDIGWIGATLIDIRFHGKEGIILQNNLGKVPLDIDVFIKGAVNQPQLLGKVEARKGVVYFRKNDFKIGHASVDFIDPNRMNPLLDIQAETKVREYQIWMAVTGTADRAVVTLLSNPSLSDVDILSLLALGKTSAELTGKESGVGMSEAASLATGQFQDMFERRARSLTGLDRFQIDPYVSRVGDTSVPRVTVGKELIRDKLYVTYSSNVGAAVPEQIFRIEYILNRNFSLVGERNEIGILGADIKYRYEFR